MEKILAVNRILDSNVRKKDRLSNNCSRSSEEKCKSGIYYINRLSRQHLIKAENTKKSKKEQAGIHSCQKTNTSLVKDRLSGHKISKTTTIQNKWRCIYIYIKYQNFQGGNREYTSQDHVKCPRNLITSQVKKFKKLQFPRYRCITNILITI